MPVAAIPGALKGQRCEWGALGVIGEEWDPNGKIGLPSLNPINYIRNDEYRTNACISSTSKVSMTF